MFCSTPKKSGSPRPPSSQIQTNVIPELYLCRSNQPRPYQDTTQHDPRKNDSFSLSDLDNLGKGHHSILEDRTEISTRRPICQLNKDICRSSPDVTCTDVENAGTYSKKSLKSHVRNFTRSTPAVNITVQQPFLGHIHLTNFGSPHGVDSDNTNHLDQYQLDSSDLSSPGQQSTHSRSRLFNINCQGQERCFEDDVSLTDSSHRIFQNRLCSRESGYHSLSIPFKRHESKTPDLQSDHSLPHHCSHLCIDSSHRCPLEESHWSVCNHKQKQEKPAYHAHVKEKKNYKNRQVCLLLEMFA